jgi:hypothetical protein
MLASLLLLLLCCSERRELEFGPTLLQLAMSMELYYTDQASFPFHEGGPAYALYLLRPLSGPSPTKWTNYYWEGLGGVVPFEWDDVEKKVVNNRIQYLNPDPVSELSPNAILVLATKALSNRAVEMHVITSDLRQFGVVVTPGEKNFPVAVGADAESLRGQGKLLYSDDTVHRILQEDLNESRPK